MPKKQDNGGSKSEAVANLGDKSPMSQIALDLVRFKSRTPSKVDSVALVKNLASKKKAVVDSARKRIIDIFDSEDNEAKWNLGMDLYHILLDGSDISFVIPSFSKVVLPEFGTAFSLNYVNQARDTAASCLALYYIKKKKFSEAEILLARADSHVAGGAARAFADAAEAKIDISKSFEALRIAISNEQTVRMIDLARKEMRKGVMQKEGNSLFSGLAEVTNADARLYLRSYSGKAFGFSIRNGKNILKFIVDIVTALFDNEQQVRESAAFALKEAEKKKHDLSLMIEIFNAMFSRLDINIRKRAASALEDAVKAGINLDQAIPVAMTLLNDREYVRKRVVACLAEFAKKSKKNAKVVLEGIGSAKADINTKEIKNLVAICEKVK